MFESVQRLILDRGEILDPIRPRLRSCLAGCFRARPDGGLSPAIRAKKQGTAHEP